MSTHVVKSGETLSSIARRYGIRSWQELYQHPLNAEFRAKRSNPNLIYPGDVIQIPTMHGESNHLGVSSAEPKLSPFAKHEAALREELSKQNFDQEQREIFMQFLEATADDWATAAFMIERAEDVVRIVTFCRSLRDLGLSWIEIREIVPVITQVKEGDLFNHWMGSTGGWIGGPRVSNWRTTRSMRKGTEILEVSQDV